MIELDCGDEAELDERVAVLANGQSECTECLHDRAGAPSYESDFEHHVNRYVAAGVLVDMPIDIE